MLRGGRTLPALVKSIILLLNKFKKFSLLMLLQLDSTNHMWLKWRLVPTKKATSLFVWFQPQACFTMQLNKRKNFQEIHSCMVTRLINWLNKTNFWYRLYWHKIWTTNLELWLLLFHSLKILKPELSDYRL